MFTSCKNCKRGENAIPAGNYRLKQRRISMLKRHSILLKEPTLKYNVVSTSKYDVVSTLKYDVSTLKYDIEITLK